MIPQNPDTENIPLTIRPYGVQVFADLERGKRFVTLFYRLREHSRAKALAHVADVIDDLARAGLTLTSDARILMSPDKGRAEALGPKTRFRCHIEIEVAPLTEAREEERAWVETLRARYGDTNAQGGNG